MLHDKDVELLLWTDSVVDVEGPKVTEAVKEGVIQIQVESPAAFPGRSTIIDSTPINIQLYIRNVHTSMPDLVFLFFSGEKVIYKTLKNN